MERRHFLGAVVSGVALVLLPSMGRETPPRLWGDGVHDDSYALQWRIDRSTAQNPFVLRNGTFALDRGMVLDHTSHIDWVDNIFRGTEKFYAPMLTHMR